MEYISFWLQESSGGEEEHEEKSPSDRHGQPLRHLLAPAQHSQLGRGSRPASQDLEVFHLQFM